MDREFLSEWGHHMSRYLLKLFAFAFSAGKGYTCSQSNEKAAHRVFSVNVQFDVSI